jgi:aspartyl-tRNA(Asn)/glutamyl-tRNA(Gln) amidotransferase subunit A
MALVSCIYAPEAYGTWRDVIEAHPEVMFAPVRERFRSGAGFSAPDYVAAWQRLDRLRAEWAADAAGFDAVLLPTVAILPPNVERALADHAWFTAENLLALRNARVATLFGLTALTLPTGVPSCGLIAMAPPGSEARLLRLGAAMEAALAA